MKITIHVTQAHIDAGNAKSCTSCPIAQAIRQSTPYVRNEVGKDTIDLYDNYGLVKAGVCMTDMARKFVAQYDNVQTRHLAQPFSFDLELPEQQT